MTKQIDLTIEPKWNREVFNVEVVPGESIRLHGTYKNRMQPQDFDKTFKLGDEAEYDSYNMRYVGKIVSIGKNTVTIEHGTEKQPERSRLKFDNFCNRNWDFDSEEIKAYNLKESYCI